MLTMKDISRAQLLKYAKEVEDLIVSNSCHMFTKTQQEKFNKLTPAEQELLFTEYMTLALKEIIKNNEIYAKELKEF
jgi:hypothetical protein